MSANKYSGKNIQSNHKPKSSKNNSNSNPIFLVISDHSDLDSQSVQQNDPVDSKYANIIESNSQQHQNLDVQPILNKENQNQQIHVLQKPIRERSYEQRLNLIKNQQKTSKKIKLTQQSLEEAKIIRFGATKYQTQQPLQIQQVNKINKIKQKKAYPWISRSTKQMQDVCLRFHNQTVEFYNYIKPSKKQHQMRLKIFNMIKQMITQKYPQAKVQYFGSFATKLYLPDGDIDITVLIDDIDEYQQRKIYDAIYKIVRKNQGLIFCDIQYIRNSKVPLIKFVHIDTQIPFDVSVNKKDGINQIQHVKRMKKIYPEFQVLVFVFKNALKIRNMSQTYTGGIGSFLLFCMILHFLRYVHKKEFYYTMGEYVMKFMQFYAINGDWQRKSIYVADSSQVGRAREPGTLSFYSPQDPSHDIGKSAFKIKDVFNVFKNRFRVITGKNFKQGESILKQLINPSGEQFRYYKYEKAIDKKTQ